MKTKHFRYHKIFESQPLKGWLFKLWNWWPPFLGAGIRIEQVDPQFRSLTVRLKLRFWNRNYVGTQFGGSMFAMTDPFMMVLLIQNLGSDYIVWDKAASIRYLKPGKTDVTARFEINDQILEQIRTELTHKEKMDWHTQIQVIDVQQQVIAEVDKTIYIRKKSKP